MSILAEIVARTRADVAVRTRGVPEADLRARLLPSTRSFCGALRAPGLSIIAEYKPKSPSAGVLRDGAPDDLVAAYDRAASAISVLCDEPYFGGGYALLRSIRSVVDRPILAKDFVVSSYQIHEARDAGADAVLLMASVLNADEIATFAAVARRLEMDVIVEAHDEHELAVALSVDGTIVGVNSRDLKTMSIDLDRARRLLEMIPKDRVRVAESGIEDPRGLAVVRRAADAALIGTALMRSSSPEDTIAALRAAQVKICGVRTQSGADACEAAGAEYAGLNFVVGRRRAIASDFAKHLVARMPSVKPVGVFLDQPVEDVRAVADDVGLAFVQLHGAESPEYCASVERPVIKAVRVDDGLDLGRLAAYRTSCASILFDGPTPGEGRAFETSRLEGVDVANDFVAGGLTPNNVPGVVRALRPLAVDTASGVETDDEMDPLLVRRFIERVRGLQ